MLKFPKFPPSTSSSCLTIHDQLFCNIQRIRLTDSNYDTRSITLRYRTAHVSLTTVHLWKCRVTMLKVRFTRDIRALYRSISHLHHRISSPLGGDISDLPVDGNALSDHAIASSSEHQFKFNWREGDRS